MCSDRQRKMYQRSNANATGNGKDTSVVEKKIKKYLLLVCPYSKECFKFSVFLIKIGKIRVILKCYL